jgi:hypothetical protein
VRASVVLAVALLAASACKKSSKEAPAGSVQRVAEAYVFDWSLDHADGTSEGGETNEILVRRQR